MSKVNDFVRNAQILGGAPRIGQTNVPSEYKSRKHQYFGYETSMFAQKYARYASDFIDAKVQGVDTERPLAWTDTRVRMADIVQPSASMTKDFDDYKIILFENKSIEYVRPGTKLTTMGSTWLATNPINVSVPDGSGVFRQCNAVWNHFDYYGNLLSEPLVCDSYAARASSANPQDTERLTRGYFNIICQYNNETAQLGTNSRIILGRAAYHIRGYADFVQEFTGDYDSIRLIGFIAEYEEPNYDIDDMTNHVAGGRNFSWTLSISGGTTLAAGQTSELVASSLRNGKKVESTEENPVSYTWKSADESIATVDENGKVMIADYAQDGTVEIAAALAQNESVSETVTITISNTVTTEARFKQAPPKSMQAYTSYTVSAADFIGGAEQDAKLTWALDGAEEGSYTYEVADNTLTVKVWSGSITPLTITAQGNGTAAIAIAELEGL